MKRPAFGPDWLAARLNALVPGFPRAMLCVAFSGGPDSLALLATLATLRSTHRGLGLRAVHVDHGLQRASSTWARHCRALARRLHVPLRVHRVAVNAERGMSLEARAREARYRALAHDLTGGESLLTAHHLEDQAETVLLQLLRGAGIAGLAAMPERAPLGAGWLVRPLLEVPRELLRASLAAGGLEALDDPMNADMRFDRVYLRREVVPGLVTRWPGGIAAIARSARHAREARALLGVLAERDLADAHDGAALRVTVLRRLALPRRRNALRAWITAQGAPLPDATRLAEIAGPLLAARADAQPRVHWRGAEVVRHGARLTLARDAQGTHGAVERRATSNGSRSWEWADSRSLELIAGRGRLAILEDAHGPLDLARLPPRLDVRERAGGEVLRPRAQGPRRTLKALLHAARVAPQERRHIPLLYAGDRLIAVADRWLDASVQAGADCRTRGRIAWERSPSRA